MLDRTELAVSAGCLLRRPNSAPHRCFAEGVAMHGDGRAKGLPRPRTALGRVRLRGWGLPPEASLSSRRRGVGVHRSRRSRGVPRVSVRRRGDAQPTTTGMALRSAKGAPRTVRLRRSLSRPTARPPPVEVPLRPRPDGGPGLRARWRHSRSRRPLRRAKLPFGGGLRRGALPPRAYGRIGSL